MEATFPPGLGGPAHRPTAGRVRRTGSPDPAHAAYTPACRGGRPAGGVAPQVLSPGPRRRRAGRLLTEALRPGRNLRPGNKRGGDVPCGTSTRRKHVPDGRAPGPGADQVSPPGSGRGGLRTEHWEQERCGLPAGRGPAASSACQDPQRMSVLEGRRSSHITPFTSPTPLPPRPPQVPQVVPLVPGRRGRGTHRVTAPSAAAPGCLFRTLPVLGVQVGVGPGHPPPSQAPGGWHHAGGIGGPSNASQPVCRCSAICTK